VVSGSAQTRTVEKPSEKKYVRPSPKDVLRFSPRAWSKLVFFRDRGDTEIGGFGISRSDDFLYVEDFVTVKQEASAAFVEFDDDAVNEFLTKAVEQGLHPAECMRIWLHTHPAGVNSPSGTDEDTFRRIYGDSDWGIMFILPKNGEAYARLQFNTGPTGHMKLPVRIDYNPPFSGVTQEELEAWEKEYQDNIGLVRYRSYSSGRSTYYGHSYPSGPRRSGEPYHSGGQGRGYSYTERRGGAVTPASGSAASRASVAGSGTPGAEASVTRRVWGGDGRVKGTIVQAGTARGSARPPGQVVESSGDVLTTEPRRVSAETRPSSGVRRGRLDVKNPWEPNIPGEHVWIVQRGEHMTTVYTGGSYYEYNNGSGIDIKEGEILHSLHQIADHLPIMRGEVTWMGAEKMGWLPKKLTTFTIRNGIFSVSYLSTPAVNQGPSAAAAGSSASSSYQRETPGFLDDSKKDEKTDEKTDEKDEKADKESDTETKVIDISEISDDAVEAVDDTDERIGIHGP
jgi:proteasome lid subunit RPN8/RPN11